MPLIDIFSELVANGRAIVPSDKVKEFSKAAKAHSIRYEIGPHVAGKSVLITI